MSNRYVPLKLTPENMPDFLNDEKRIEKHNGHGYASFELWFENGATNTFIMEKTGIRTQNTVRDYRQAYEARKNVVAK